jgi:hypothetical protein
VLFLGDEFLSAARAAEVERLVVALDAKGLLVVYRHAANRVGGHGLWSVDSG